VRRLLKTGPGPAPNSQTDDVRAEVAKAELDAELVELDILDRWAADLDDAPAARPATELAMAAMEVAVLSYSTAELGDDDRRALALIAAAAAPHGEAMS
jgi:hypothetical protein